MAKTEFMKIVGQGAQKNFFGSEFCQKGSGCKDDSPWKSMASPNNSRLGRTTIGQPAGWPSTPGESTF